MILFQTELTLARGMLYNPRWTWHAAEVLNEEAVYAPQYMRSSRALRGLPIPGILLFRPQIMVLLGKKDHVSGCRTVLQVKVSFATTQPATIPVASITYQGS